MANGRLTTSVEELRKAIASLKMPGELRSRQFEMREWPRLRDEYEAIRIAQYDDEEALRTAVQRACVDDPDMCRRLPVDQIIRG
ncbi:MAG: hypothetical protein DMF86_14135, partial [Acidobacteria bacterium]